MKKKLLSVVLALALVLTMVVSVVACDKTSDVEKAAEAFRKLNITIVYNTASYDLAGQTDYEGVTYTITWSSDKNTVAFAPSADGKTVKVTVTKTAEKQDYKLIATLKDAKGNTATVEFKGSIEAAVGEQHGTAYKLVIRQLKNGNIIYAKAAAGATYYVDSTTKMADGADFYLEDVAGGKKIYTLSGTTKCYLGAKISNGHNNICLGGVVGEMDAANYQGSVWTVSENEIKTTVDGKTLYLGTYGTNKTFSVSETKTFPAFLVESGIEVKAQAQIKASSQNTNATVTFTSHTPVDGAVVVDVDTVVTFTVAVDAGYELVSVVKNGSTVLEAVDGVYSVTVKGNVDITVVTKAEGSNGAKSPVTCEIQDEIPIGWLYITNDEQYPDPAYYGTNGKHGLQMKYANGGISSPELDSATGDITVKLNIFALNKSQTPGTTADKIFTIEGLDEKGEVVVTATIDTVEVGEKNETVLHAGDKIIKSIRIVMTNKPIVDGYEQNVNLGGVTISWTTEATTPSTGEGETGGETPTTPPTGGETGETTGGEGGSTTPTTGEGEGTTTPTTGEGTGDSGETTPTTEE